MSSLREMIADLRKLDELPTAAAAAAAPLIEAEAKRTAAAGTTPAGKPWASRQDGQRALKGAAAHVKAIARGTTVTIELDGAEYFHNYGAGGRPKRQVIPDKADDMPAGIEAAVKRGTDQAFSKMTGGG